MSNRGFGYGPGSKNLYPFVGQIGENFPRQNRGCSAHRGYPALYLGFIADSLAHIYGTLESQMIGPRRGVLLAGLLIGGLNLP